MFSEVRFAHSYTYAIRRKGMRDCGPHAASRTTTAPTRNLTRAPCNVVWQAWMDMQFFGCIGFEDFAVWSNNGDGDDAVEVSRRVLFLIALGCGILQVLARIATPGFVNDVGPFAAST